MSEQDKKAGIERVVEIAGSQEAVAHKCGVTQQAVSRWVARGYAPLARAIELEAQYGVDRRELVDPKIVGLLS